MRPMMLERAGGSLVAAAILAMSACSAEETSEADAPAAEPAPSATADADRMTVTIVSPAEGETVTSPVRVVLAVEGLDVVPAGQEQPRAGHHHLIVDADLPPMDAPIPAIEGQYIHMGQAQTELEISLTPGEHRIIALVGDHVHVPLSPPVADTVHVIVRE